MGAQINNSHLYVFNSKLFFGSKTTGYDIENINLKKYRGWVYLIITLKKINEKNKKVKNIVRVYVLYNF